ncbi:hypothetical protein NPIL_406361, partial [Nephila pilipes]
PGLDLSDISSLSQLPSLSDIPKSALPNIPGLDLSDISSLSQLLKPFIVVFSFILMITNCPYVVCRTYFSLSFLNQSN